MFHLHKFWALCSRGKKGCWEGSWSPGSNCFFLSGRRSKTMQAGKICCLYWTLNGEFFNIRFTAISKSGVVISLEVHITLLVMSYLIGFVFMILSGIFPSLSLLFLICIVITIGELKKKKKKENIFKVNKLFIYIYIFLNSFIYLFSFYKNYIILKYIKF